MQGESEAKAVVGMGSGSEGGCVGEGNRKGGGRGESEGWGEGGGEGEGGGGGARRTSGVATSSIGVRAWKSAGPELDETCRPSMATPVALAVPAAAGAVQAAGELAGGCGCGCAGSGCAGSGSDAMAQERSCWSVQLYQWKCSCAPVPDW